MIGVLLAGIKFAFNGQHGLKIYTILVLIAAFIVPLIIIVLSYVVIFHTANKIMKEAIEGGNLTQELRVAKTISVIIGLFVICWCPFFILNMLFIFCSDFCDAINNLPWLVNVSKALHYSNSMMNFFVYAVRSPDFRRTFKALIFDRCSTKSLRERVQSFGSKRGSFISKRGSFQSKRR